jgi:hypothetical protein
METKFEKKLSDMDTKFDAKLSAIDQKFSSKFDDVDKRFIQVIEKINALQVWTLTFISLGLLGVMAHGFHWI